MWVFGYGSLMWDNWETQFGGVKRKATLYNYQRDFNKKSTSNWGTQTNPGPTLGLESRHGACCVGYAFEFPDKNRQSVLDCLRKREGRSFQLEELDITLENNATVRAFAPVNNLQAHTYIGNIALEKRARMAAAAIGSSGRCIVYVRNIYEKLKELEVKDSQVDEFWAAVCAVVDPVSQS